MELADELAELEQEELNKKLAGAEAAPIHSPSAAVPAGTLPPNTALATCDEHICQSHSSDAGAEDRGGRGGRGAAPTAGAARHVIRPRTPSLSHRVSTTMRPRPGHTHHPCHRRAPFLFDSLSSIAIRPSSPPRGIPLPSFHATDPYSRPSVAPLCRPSSVVCVRVPTSPRLGTWCPSRPRLAFPVTRIQFYTRRT